MLFRFCTVYSALKSNICPILRQKHRVTLYDVKSKNISKQINLAKINRVETKQNVRAGIAIRPRHSTLGLSPHRRHHLSSRNYPPLCLSAAFFGEKSRSVKSAWLANFASLASRARKLEVFAQVLVFDASPLFQQRRNRAAENEPGEYGDHISLQNLPQKCLVCIKNVFTWL